MKALSLIFFTCFVLSSELFCSSNDDVEELSFEHQISRYQSSLEQTKQMIPFFSDETNKSPELNEICRHAIKIIRKEFDEKEDLEVLEAIQQKIEDKIASQELTLKDLKTLFLQLVFLREHGQPSSELAKQLVKRYHSGEDNPFWWHDDQHPFFKACGHAAGPFSREMFLICDEGDSLISAHLKAFIKDPKSKAYLFPFGQDSKLFMDTDNILFYHMFNNSNFLPAAKNSDQLSTLYSEIVEELWDENDALSTFFLYILSHDYVTLMSFSPRDNEIESDHEVVLGMWIKHLFCMTKRFMVEKAPYLENFFNELDPIKKEGVNFHFRVFMSGKALKIGEQKWSVPVRVFTEDVEHYYPHLYSYTVDQSSTVKHARVSFIIQGFPRSDTSCELSVVGFENWENPSDFITPVGGMGPPLFGDLKGGDGDFFLPFLTPLINQKFTASSSKYYSDRFFMNYLPLLQTFFPTAGLTGEKPEETMAFFENKAKEFYDQSLEKLKKFRD